MPLGQLPPDDDIPGTGYREWGPRPSKMSGTQPRRSRGWQGNIQHRNERSSLTSEYPVNLFQAYHKPAVRSLYSCTAARMMAARRSCILGIKNKTCGQDQGADEAIFLHSVISIPRDRPVGRFTISA